MTHWLIEVSQRHSSAVAPWRDLVAADTFPAALAEALGIVLTEDLVVDDIEEYRDAIRGVANQLAEPAPPGSDRLIPLRIKEYPDADEPTLFLVWHNAPERPGEKPNIGIGPGYYDEHGTYKLAGKDENRWLKMTEWDGNPKRRQELAALSKDELIDRLVRLEALEGGAP